MALTAGDGGGEPTFFMGLHAQALVRAEGHGGRRAQESGVRHKYTGFPQQIRDGADSCIVWSRSTALSPPAYEQCPVSARVRADRPISAARSERT